MTAPSATELPTAQPNVPANSRHPGPRAVPSVSSVLILPPGPIVDRHRRPQERLQAARRPPAYPNQARIIAPVTPSHPSAVLTPSTCMNRWIRAKRAVCGIRQGQRSDGESSSAGGAASAGSCVAEKRRVFGLSSAADGGGAQVGASGTAWSEAGAVLRTYQDAVLAVDGSDGGQSDTGGWQSWEDGRNLRRNHLWDR